MTASTPGFWSPIELSIPPGVSVTRGVGLPIRGLSVVPLQQMRAEPVDLDDVAVLDPVAERPRRDEDRVGQDEPAAQVDGQVDVGLGLDRRRPARGRPSVAARRADRPLTSHAPSQAISSAAKTGPSRQTRCGVPLVAHDHAAEARPDRAAHVLLHRDLQERLPPCRRRADRVRLAAAALAAELGDAEPLAAGRRRAARARRASAPARRRTPGRPSPRSRRPARSRSRDGRASRRRSRRRTRPRRAAGSTGRPRATLAAPNSSVTWRPSRIASSASIRTPAIPRPPATSSRCWLRGSTSNGRPSGPSRSTLSPGRRRVNHSVPRPMTRKWIVIVPVAASAVLSENGRRRTMPGEVPGPDMDELAGPRPDRELRGVVAPGATGPAGSPGSRRAPPRRAASSRGRLVLAPSSSAARRRPLRSSARRRRPRRRRPRRRRLALGACRRAPARPTGRPRRASRPGRRRRRSGRRTRRARRRCRASATRPAASSGMTSASERAGRGQDQPLVVVVDDDQVADDAGQRRPRRPRTRSRRRASLRWLRSWYSSARSYSRLRGGLVVVRVERVGLAGRPRVGGARRTGPRRRATVSSGEMPAASRTSVLAGRLGGRPGRLAGGLGERGVDVGRVVELDELGGASR